MFRGRLVCVTCALFFDQKWRRNAPVRNAPFTQPGSRHSSRSASPARCRSGRERRVAVSGAIRRSTPPVGARGARTSAAGPGNENTSGGSPARRPSAGRSTAACVQVARPPDVTARSTTSLHATGTVTAPAATITSTPTNSATGVSRCCVAHIMRRSRRLRPPRAPRRGGPPSWQAKLRSSRGVS